LRQASAAAAAAATGPVPVLPQLNAAGTDVPDAATQALQALTAMLAQQHLDSLLIWTVYLRSSPDRSGFACSLSMSAQAGAAVAREMHRSSSNIQAGTGWGVRTLAVSELQLVFSYLNEKDLPRIARVSSVWCRAVDSPLVWKQLFAGVLHGSSTVDVSQLAHWDFFTRPSLYTHMHAPPNLFRSGVVQRYMPVAIDFISNVAYMEEDVQYVTHNLNRLDQIVRVHLGPCPFTEVQLTQIVNSCHKAWQMVRKITIEEQFIHTDALRTLVLRCPQLTELEYDVKSQLDTALFDRAPSSLRVVTIRIRGNLEPASWMVLAQLPNLTSLRIEEQLTTNQRALPSVTPEESLFPSLVVLILPILRLRRSFLAPPQLETDRSLWRMMTQMSHLRAINFTLVGDDARRFAMALECLAGLPSGILPCLQHLVLDQFKRGIPTEVYKQVFANLPALLVRRPVDCFTIHLRLSQRGAVSRASTARSLPCFLVHPTIDDVHAMPIDEAELARLDAIVSQQPKMTKASMLVVIAEEEAKGNNFRTAFHSGSASCKQ
jgi:hypothetical protein